MRKGYLAVFALVFAGCTTSPDITAWNMAKSNNTAAAYQSYVQRYPKGAHAKEAGEQVEKLKLDNIRKADSVAECIRIMETNPDPKIAAEVADLAFNAAQKETGIGPLVAFLAYFRNHSGAQTIRTRLEEMDFENARKDSSPASMEYFLFRYPESRYAGKARETLAERSYGQVKVWGNQYGYKAFLAKFPESPRAAEVRGWIKAPAPQAGNVTPGSRQALAGVLETSPWLKNYGCALTLSSMIRKRTGDADELRRRLYEFEKLGPSGTLPAECASMTLEARSGSEGALDEALGTLGSAEKRRKELAGLWEAFREREEMAKTAIAAGAKVANDLETAELSEEVLGSGPLGGLDAGREKGSVSARKAVERFEAAEKILRKDREEIKGMLADTDGFYRPLQYYVASCLAGK